MNIDFFYKAAVGRSVFTMIQALGGFRAAAWFLKTPFSKILIPGFIRRNKLDMTPYAGQTYGSFAEFFAREKSIVNYIISPNTLISPCDGMLSVYPISEDMSIPMKGSHYVLPDLVPDQNIAKQYTDGLCMVFRLRAQDYHHFCCIDTADLTETHFIPGTLHSVQPIACRSVPVFHLNRRWWSVLDTAYFDRVVQIEVGAMAVGGVAFEKTCGFFTKGGEMGHFELMGSTIILLLKAGIRKELILKSGITEAIKRGQEVQVTMGQGIGVLRNEKECISE